MSAKQKNRKFPIRDIQFHEERLSSMEEYDGSNEARALIQWHTTAIAFLRYGAFKQLGGPAVEAEVDGTMQPQLVEDYLLLVFDRHGNPVCKYVTKK